MVELLYLNFIYDCRSIRSLKILRTKPELPELFCPVEATDSLPTSSKRAKEIMLGRRTGEQQKRGGLTKSTNTRMRKSPKRCLLSLKKIGITCSKEKLQ